DADFTTSPADMELLQTLAERGESVQTAVLTGIGDGFFPGKSLAQVAKLPDPGTLFRETAFEKWRSIREKECARWLAVAANRFLLRDPWTPESARGVEYTEKVSSADDLLWGSAAHVIAAACCRSFAKEHWPTEITGYEAGRFDSMSLRDSDGAGSAKIPTEAMFGEDQAKGLYDAGLITLVVEPNRDSVFVMRAPTVLLPAKTDDDHLNVVNRRMAQLPYQLLAARLGEEVFHHKNDLTGDGEIKTVHDNWEKFLGSIFASTGDGAGVAVSVDKDPENPDSGRLLVQLRVRTGKKILKSVDVQFGFYLG
ncbi:MAG: type VI secretion system contractile sheath large subunit, partial [Planctomycetota bacterium]